MMKRDMYHTKPFFLRARTLIPALLLLLLGVACTDPADELTADDGRTATLRLLVPRPDATTRVDPTEDYENSLKAEERAIHTLRIVVYSLSDGNNATTVNRLYTKEELAKADTDEKGNAVLTIEGIPTGTAQICAIANEASIGRDYSNILNMQKEAVTVGKNSKVLIVDTMKYFPKRGTQLLEEADTVPKGLPMSWMEKNCNIQESGNTLDVELERCVAKIRMEVHNNFSENIKVKEISFGSFFGNSFYLFRDTDLDVPSDQTYVPQTFTEDVAYTIAPGRSEVLILYFYPSFARTSSTQGSPYTVGYKTALGNYPAMAFLGGSGSSFNSIPRNKQVNIDVTLSGDTNVQTSFDVVDWTDVTIYVPDFN